MTQAIQNGTIPQSTLAAGVLEGNRRALTRLLTLVENHDPRAREALRALHPRTGRAHIIGVTGPGGSGKSTLVDVLTKELRRRGKTVGIVAVDPSSAFTGGAILGDRVRMQDLIGDNGVFLRSMATRGAMGGLAEATGEMIQVLDAFGKDVIIVETVGTGQDEVDVVRTAHTVLVVTIPGGGDDIQALKAGILEIADIFVVNKADRAGADQVVADLRYMLNLQPPKERKPPILKTSATRNQGIAELVDAIAEHHQYLQESGNLLRGALERTREQILSLAKQTLYERLLKAAEPTLEATVVSVLQRELDPRSAADTLVALALREASGGDPPPHAAR